MLAKLVHCLCIVFVFSIPRTFFFLTHAISYNIVTFILSFFSSLVCLSVSFSWISALIWLWIVILLVKLIRLLYSYWLKLCLLASQIVLLDISRAHSIYYPSRKVPTVLPFLFLLLLLLLLLKTIFRVDFKYMPWFISSRIMSLFWM